MRDKKTYLSDEQFRRYLELCRRVYERMRRENRWPWSDSPDLDDVVESEDSQNDI
jgi:hypothetical protein